MGFSDEVEALGKNAVDIVTEAELQEKLDKSAREKSSLRIKYGADPSASDIHLGHTVPLLKLRQFQEMGHEVVFLIGDFTAMIGDPSGANKSRPVLSAEEVKKNARTYQQQVFKILDKEKTTVVYNSSWCGKMKLSDFIRLSSCYTVARMLERDDFSLRHSRNDSIGMHEFLYPLIQAYDSVHLRADVELGGSDQRFNLLIGREIQRHFGQEPQVVILMPLLEGTDGEKKMSKSLGNYIGITDEPGEMYGKIMSIPDKILSRYYALLLKEELPGDADPYSAKKELAEKITAVFHGHDDAQRAAIEFKRVFSQKNIPERVPDVLISKNLLREGGIRVAELVVAAGFAGSKNEARRLVRNGGFSIGGTVLKDAESIVKIEDGMLLRAGKRRFCRITTEEIAHGG